MKLSDKVISAFIRDFEPYLYARIPGIDQARGEPEVRSVPAERNLQCEARQVRERRELKSQFLRGRIQSADEEECVVSGLLGSIESVLCPAWLPEA